jgi:hypothetical protein
MKPVPACPAEPGDPASLAELEPDIPRRGCVLAGTNVSLGAAVELVSGPEDGVPLGTITASVATALWDFQDGTGFARVTARHGARVRAFAHARAFELQVRDNIWIHQYSVAATLGTPLHVERSDAGKFRVRVVTPFDEPKLLDATAECADLAFGTPFPEMVEGEVAPSEFPESTSDVYVQLKNDGATLYDAPKGKKLFSFRFTREPNYPIEVERRKGFVRLVAWYDQIHIDAWVSRSEVTYPARIGGGSRVRTPKVRIAQLKGKPGITLVTTPILVDTAVGAVAVGELPEGTPVRLGESRGEMREVHFGWLEPPAGSSFRVKDVSVGACTPPPEKAPEPVEAE